MIVSKPAASSTSTICAGRARHAAQVAARGERADEDVLVRAVLAHADAVAEHGAAGDRAGRVDGDDRDALAAREQCAEQRVDQRRLARARRAGDAQHVRAAEVRRRWRAAMARAPGSPCSIALIARAIARRSPARIAASRGCGTALSPGPSRLQTIACTCPNPISRRSVAQISPCVQPASAAATTCAKTLSFGSLAARASASSAFATASCERAALHARNAAMCVAHLPRIGLRLRRAARCGPRRPGTH